MVVTEMSPITTPVPIATALVSVVATSLEIQTAIPAAAAMCVAMAAVAGLIRTGPTVPVTAVALVVVALALVAPALSKLDILSLGLPQG